MIQHDFLSVLPAGSGADLATHNQPVWATRYLEAAWPTTESTLRYQDDALKQFVVIRQAPSPD